MIDKIIFDQPQQEKKLKCLNTSCGKVLEFESMKYKGKQYCSRGCMEMHATFLKYEKMVNDIDAKGFVDKVSILSGPVV